MARRYLVAGNWKMHGLASDLGEVAAIASGAERRPDVDVALCLPATLIERAARALPAFAIGGQDVHAEDKGAHTGDIGAAMLSDAGASLTIVGHSERRADHGESDEGVQAKAAAALASGLDVILCVGESLEVRKSGQAIPEVERQLLASLPEFEGNPSRLSVAYEPIWAIGTGLVPSLEDIAAMHGALRQQLVDRFGAAGGDMRILYGGSVKASNAGEILAIDDVDGALVGGASLKSADFLPIVEAAPQS
ncbi:triose-phosphate isomerase [Sphingomonas sp. HDW15A]|uniref:triose-phosphate isomerase n=1 Tax=Sphingomonas sp. HDW15A TaxID=2714942 RepID=UPI0014073F02|nr:triose-phosphate isomerase [Sphingomonas sp. HDW15A]QIK95742.1 triose-phosphate isomerase [Sphingomonas sp. HDW15A]